MLDGGTHTIQKPNDNRVAHETSCRWAKSRCQNHKWNARQIKLKLLVIKATQLDHQELFRHIVGACNDVLNRKGGPMEKRGEYNKEKERKVNTHTDTHTHRLGGGGIRSQVMKTTFHLLTDRVQFAPFINVNTALSEPTCDEIIFWEGDTSHSIQSFR